jgi:hypothetical protein
MKLRTEIDNDGWQIVNALWGDGLEGVKTSIDRLDSNTGLNTVDPNYPRQVWRDDITDEIPEWSQVEAFAKDMNVDGARVIVKIVDRAEEFLEGPITRFSYDYSQMVSPSGTNTSTYGASGILGIAYVEGNAATPSGGYLINFKVPADERWSSALYDGNWVEASGYQFGYSRHDYDTNGYDEYLYVTTATPSTQLEFEPSSGAQLNILDINNVDASGYAAVVPSADYTLDGKWVNFTSPSSLYVAEYNRKSFPWSKFVTFQDRFHTNYNWINRPTLATDDTQGGEIEIPFEYSKSNPAPSAIVLRVDPNDVRPGNVATVRFDYPNYQQYDWNSPWDDLDVSVTDPVMESLQRNAFVLRDSASSLVNKTPYNNVEPSGTSGIGISGSSITRDTDFEGVAPSVAGPSGWSFSSGAKRTNSIHATDLSQVIELPTDTFIHQKSTRPVVDSTYVANVTLGGVSGVASTNLNINLIGYNEANVGIGSLTTNIVPTITDAGSDGFETHTVPIRLPLNTHTIKVTLEAKTSGMYVSNFKLEPLNIFNLHDYSRKYTEPFTLDVWFNAKSVYNVSGVQSLSTASGVIHPYGFDWRADEKRNTHTNKKEQHYSPYTILPIGDPSGYIDNALASGRLDQFTVTVPREIIGITYAPEDRLLEINDKRVVYAIERHQQTLNTFDTLGRPRSTTPLFCPDLTHPLNNFSVIPSGGNYLYPNPSGRLLTERPFISYDLHNDLTYADDDSTQLYREPRGMEYRNGHLYIVTAVTDQQTAYDARPSGTATFGELADSIIYRHDTWDEERIHITPSGEARFPLYETITNPTDMSWDPSGALLIGHSGQVHKYIPHWDYVIFDRDDRVAYYREYYD